MSADSPRCSSGSRGIAVPAIVPPQVVIDRSILDSAIGFINDVTYSNQPHTDPKDTITWARFESAADISDPRFGEDWELEGNVAPPLLLALGYGLGVQVWAIPANGEAVEVLSWRHGVVTALRVLPTPACTSTIEQHGRADEAVDHYAEKRPLIALVDGNAAGTSQQQFCAVNFISLKSGTQVKTIKFKNPVLDVLANRTSIAITLCERIAVFDACTLEDRLTITTCFPSPGINPNPVALGPRWLAYAEHRLIHSKRSGGGCDGDGVASYTATMLNAAKSFGKGLRELGEQVAAGLTGTTGTGLGSKNNSFDSNSGADAKQPGVVTILDIKHSIKDYSPTTSTPMSGHAGSDPIVAHFIAHPEAVVGLEFDNSGLLMLTADRRGHDFHVFRIQPHPLGSSLAAVHHLYVLHRGDTSAKVQNITFSLDSRWVAVSTLRGTTHVFPITPYGGPMGVRTHTSLHVVNKLSRFHRSAGLPADGRSSSPISHSESTTFVQSLQPYHNPTLPPYPRPTVVLPLLQLRQPFVLGTPPGSATLPGSGKAQGGGSSSSSQRQRLSSLSDDTGKPLSVCAIFAKSRSWLLDPPNVTREAPHRMQRKSVDSLFVMAGHGALIQYDLDTKLASNVAKEKICDDTPIELEVEAKAQWNLGRRKDGSQEVMPPLASDNWLIKDRYSCMLTDSTRQYDDSDDHVESWLSQVEIITHAGPHRRLWMGPQFVFKTYNTPSGSNLNHVDAEAVEIGVSKPTTAAAAAATRAAERSNPLNMPLSATGRTPVPVLIESGSYSSIEQSPKLMDRFRHDHLDSDFAVAHGDTRLKEDLADAMRESPSVSAHKTTGRISSDAASSDNVPFYDALDEHEHDHDDDIETGYDAYRSSSSSAAVAALACALPNIYSYDTSSGYESLDVQRKPPPQASIAKIVNPLGTVTTVNMGMSTEVRRDILDEVVSQLAAEDCVIHENCDEALFRPVVAIFCDKEERQREVDAEQRELCHPPEVIKNKLIVPVIAKDVDAELCRKEKQKSGTKAKAQKLAQMSERAKQNSDKCVDRPKVSCDKKTVIAATSKEIEIKKTSEKQAPKKSNEKQADCKTTHSNAKKTDDAEEESLERQLVADGTNESLSVKNITKSNLKCETNERPVAIEQKSNQQKLETKAQISIETCALNVAELQDSLIEAFPVESEEELEILKPTLAPVKHLEPAETRPPQKSLKKSKSKNKQNKSGSNSESDEVVEVVAPKSSKAKRKSIELESICLQAPLPDYYEKPIQTEASCGHEVSKNKSVESCDGLRKYKSEDSSADESKKSKIPSDEPKHEALKIDGNSEEGSEQTSAQKYANSSDEESEKNRAIFESFMRTDERKVKSAESTMRKSLGVAEKNEPPAKVWSERTKFSKTTPETVISVIKSNPKRDIDEATTTAGLEAEAYKKMMGEKPDDEIISIEEHIVDIKTKSKSDKLEKGKTSVENATPKVSLAQETMTKVAEIEPKIKTSKDTTPKEAELKKPLKKGNETASLSKSKLNSSEPEEAIKKLIEAPKCDDVLAKTAANSPRKQTGCGKSPAIAPAPLLPPTPQLQTSSPATLEDNKTATIILKKTVIELEPPIPAQKKASLKSVKSANDIVEVSITLPVKNLKGSKNSKISNLGSSSIENVSDSGTKTKKDLDIKLAPPPAPIHSAWKMLSGAEMINKNFDSLLPEKLLPDLPIAVKPIQDIAGSKSSNKKAKRPPSVGFDDFPALQPLENLPPIPSLEPLEVLSMDKSPIEKDQLPEQISLINFESPLQENPALTRKITPPPRGFSEQNLIFALCGSLHYEHENMQPRAEPMEEQEKVHDLQFSSIAEKVSYSSNSSASEEIIVVEEKKMTKKQKRKKQQQQLELQKQQEEQHDKIEVDEELRPLISMSESQVENFVDTFSLDTGSYALKPVSSSTLLGGQSTTTDSEGPMPSTTSDDNVFKMPTATSSNTPKKLTKKMEYKINLMTAIEAVTSSSTSSAEESGVEASGRLNEMEGALFTVAATPVLPLQQTTGSTNPASATKKKTKRRKR